MKIIEVSNEKEYIFNVFESLKDELLIIPTNENKNIIICEEGVLNSIKEFLEIILIQDLNRSNRGELIKYIKTNNLHTTGRVDFISSYSD